LFLSVFIFLEYILIILCLKNYLSDAFEHKFSSSFDTNFDILINIIAPNKIYDRLLIPFLG